MNLSIVGNFWVLRVLSDTSYYRENIYKKLDSVFCFEWNFGVVSEENSKDRKSTGNTKMKSPILFGPKNTKINEEDAINLFSYSAEKMQNC